MKYCIYIGLLFFCCTAKAQLYWDFEDVIADSGTVKNGKDGKKIYSKRDNSTNAKVTFTTDWDTSFGGYWSGQWAFSSKQDSSTEKSNFGKHLYCTKSKKGYNNSKVFAIGTQNAGIKAENAYPEMYFNVSNTTFAYNSMKLGDAFAKKFGGATGKDPDYFLLTVYGYYNKNLYDSTKIYLADYRFSDDTKDYILKDWKGGSIKGDSFRFMLSSSDVGGFGMNTPAYFVLDNISFIPNRVQKIAGENAFKVNYDAEKKELHLWSNETIEELTILDLQGKKVSSVNKLNGKKTSVNLQQFKPGMCIIAVSINGKICTQKVYVE